ncbi:MAG: TonB-dependent receptor [Brevundimonas sp.]|uniref:TonB-dependent receptor n=1 Tax=Brevundimonas sp. TaxID=1871086 RepID=UPI00271B90BA|nr:TonB-dependent receptor [Brevundimonas sp.]MDO9078320.1 TonB-dependent receptor [Brevundimonas sp.]MDP3079651.1 TonB-dependent receptor [Brevundimonas sp.]MDZ4061832.1 TonB-dependent receptor [Brevundimonas sp.]
MTRKSIQYLGAASALAMAVSLACAGGASAQGATSTLRGTIYEGQAVETGGSITATEIATGYVSRGRIGADGGYVLSGLRPGTYRINATTADGQSVEDVITIALGQVATLDLDVAPVVTGSTEAGAAELDDVIVTGRRIFEVRTSEVATNVSQTQINNLPQISRNFLNFAALAPGVRVTEGETERTISAGGQGAAAINVFIDGQNQKSTIIDGGVGGQDDSRGNPFPQVAIQEFRVISQNFKAEYEQASSSIITSVTRSGTNELTGDAFITYQDSDWTSEDGFGRPVGVERLQYGGSIGGPIIEDRLHFFGAYERKDETRYSTVQLFRAAYAPLFGADTGTFEAPFEEDLFFGKLSWSIDDRQRLDLSATYRTEADIRDFGFNNAYSRANEINTDVASIVLRHQYQGDGFLNEAQFDFYEYTYNPTALNFSDYGRSFVIFRDDNAAPGFQYNVFNREDTVFNTGGQSNNQDIRQRSFTFRNDLTFNDIEWNGNHTIKMGVKFSAQNMYVNKQFGRNPQFIFDVDARPEINGSRDIPVRVELGAEVAPADVDNNVFGLYIQDDWQITSQLEVNLGLRWDYEDNAVNNDYSTPQAIRDTLNAIQALPGYDFPSYFNPADYITDGRDAFTGAFQPRIGFSYDVFDDERTVIFGGAGRYYDRVGFNFAFDERFKAFQFNKEIFFSVAGGMRGGVNTVAWNPTYLTPAGLDPLLDAAPGSGEIFLLNNDMEPPRTDQFNLGIRQKFGDFQTALTFAYGNTSNLFAWYIANAGSETGDRFSGPTPGSVGHPEFRNLIFFGNNDAEQTFKAMYLTVDKPFDTDSGWGMSFTYTLSEAERNGSRDGGIGGFDFDYNRPGLSPTFPTNQDERHRIVATGIVALPMDFRLSGILTLGSGLPFHQFVCPTASNPDICWNGGRPEGQDFLFTDTFAFRQIDLRLTKSFDVFNGQTVEMIFDAINVFNFENYNGFEQCLCSPNYGVPNNQYIPTRSFQVGLRYRW